MVKAKPSGATKQALLAKSRACDDKSVELLAQKRAVAFIARRSTSVEHLVNKAIGEKRERAEALSENHAFRGAVTRESSKTVNKSLWELTKFPSPLGEDRTLDKFTWR